MTRLHKLLIFAGLLAAVGCRTFEDRPALFPRLRNAVDEDRAYADRLRDRYNQPPAVAATNPCLPCAGMGGTYPSGMTLGMPTVVGGGYTLPTGFSSQPMLGPPTYPNGEGMPYRPRRDDELPLPGEYSRPGAAETGRNIAPKPPGSLPTGK